MSPKKDKNKMAQYAQVYDVYTSPYQEQAAGGLVTAYVQIKNLFSAPISVMAGVALEHGETPWPTVSMSPDWITLNSAQIYTFSGTFYMPNQNVTIHGYSYWYGADEAWHFDDEKTVLIRLSSQQGVLSNLVVSYGRI